MQKCSGVVAGIVTTRYLLQLHTVCGLRPYVYLLITYWFSFTCSTYMCMDMRMYMCMFMYMYM